MQSTDPLLWLAAPAALVAAAVPAAAQVYMNEAQALAAVLGEQVTARREQKTLSEASRQKLQELSGLRFPEAYYTFFVGEQNGKVGGYAVVLDEIGKSEPITFMVGMSPASNVTEVVVMIFRESRGWEVKEKRFLRQFRGKTAKDPIRINQDILNYSGATLSSKAVARGVKRALLLLNVFYPPGSRDLPAHLGRLDMPAPPAPIATFGELALYRQARYLMGTLCEIRLWTSSPRDAARQFAAALAELRRLDGMFSNYRDDSELARVNREAVDRPVEVSPEFFDLACYALRQWRRTGGAFDATVGPLVKTWGFWSGEPRVPAPQELARARGRVGSEKLRLDARARTVRFLQPEMELDFGGLAKGYAAGCAGRVARTQGAVAALANLGGSSLYASGDLNRQFVREAGRRNGADKDLLPGEWPIAVADPREPQRPALYLLPEPGWALSTSGTYEQQFQAGERRFSHLIDPRTGWPLEGLRSVTVVAHSARHCEVLAKQFLFSAARWGTLPRSLKRSDWALLEADPRGGLRMLRNFRRVTQLLPLPA